MTIKFARDGNGKVLLDRATCESAAARMQEALDAHTHPTISSEVRNAAGAELVQLARQLAFDTKVAFYPDGVLEASRRRPDLCLLSTLPVAGDAVATVGA
jgi:hypothetical protein